MSIQDPQLGQEQRMGGVGRVPLPGACLGMQRRISAWGMPKSGKKPKFPAGGQCGEQEETDFWMKPCLNSLPRGLGAGSYVQWQYVRGGVEGPGSCR